MIFLFADEAGNFDFSLKGTRYFIVTSITMEDWQTGTRLLDLRHELAFKTQDLREEGLHATYDKQHIRDEVFKSIKQMDFKIDAVLLDKRKTYKYVAQNEAHFYQLSWHFLLKYIAKQLPDNDDILIVAGSLGTKTKKTRFKQALDLVIKQHINEASIAVSFWNASSHPCLQIADYCAWAIQRWKERDDDRSLVLIKDKVSSLYEPFENSTKFYY